MKSAVLALSTLLSDFYQQARANWVKSRLHRVTVCIGLFSFILIALLINTGIHQHKVRQQALLASYSKALGQITSDQLSISMSKQNRIGMQAILVDLMKQAKVHNAVVYDVDNRILVQAGDINEIARSKTYTTPITVDDALLGSLTITIEDNTQGEYRLLFALILSFLSLGCLLLLSGASRISGTNTLQKTISQKTSSQKTEDAKKAYTTNITNDAANKEPVTQHQALLKLHFYNIDKVYQQLSADLRVQKFKTVEALIDKILTLYSGKTLAASPSTLLLSFTGEDKNTNLFNAICSAKLLLESIENAQSLILFSALIYDGDQALSCTELVELKSLKSNDYQGAIIHKDHIGNIQNRLILEASNNPNYYYIKDLVENYRVLLDKQIKCLS